MTVVAINIRAINNSKETKFAQEGKCENIHYMVDITNFVW